MEGGPLTFVIGQTLEEIERVVIIETFKSSGRNRTRTAKILGISVRNLYSKLKAIEKSAPEVKSGS